MVAKDQNGCGATQHHPDVLQAVRGVQGVVNDEKTRASSKTQIPQAPAKPPKSDGLDTKTGSSIHEPQRIVGASAGDEPGAAPAWPVGFYESGCQVKTLLLSREEGIFLRHPVPARSSTNSLQSAARLIDCIGRLRDHVSCVLSRSLIAPLSSVMAIANHGSI